MNGGILARCRSVVVMFLARRYAWSFNEFVSGRLLPRNADFMIKLRANNRARYYLLRGGT